MTSCTNFTITNPLTLTTITVLPPSVSIASSGTQTFAAIPY